ncbi:phage head spike fiber domain-containing protein [Salmonirosea aquatica]|uniref:Uncharacterized protein n=1 Tax=Salmonirosea aquatica TaxID=2654236 RepID=A0A7C9BI66_9BACT|nr:hypothetical protein [Cytophagaceae bacterium SJW1-29]
MPPTGFLGAAGLTDVIADAMDFAPRGLTHIEQDADGSLVLHYNDGTQQAIPAYFADVLEKVADFSAKYEDFLPKYEEVNNDTVSVTMSRADVENRQADIIERQEDIAERHGDIAAKHQEVDNDAVSVTMSRADVQGWYVTIQGWFNAISGWFPSIQTMYDAIAGWFPQIEVWQQQVSDNVALSEAKRVEVNGLVSQAAEIVFNGSTDWPTVPPLASWHCDSGELDPRLELAFTGNLTTCDRRGILRSAPQAARALHYDALTGKCLGLPVWPSSENVLLRSGNLSVSPWVVTGAGAVAQQADGYLITLDNTQADILFSQTSAIPAAGETWTGSIVLKAGSIADIGKEVVLQLRRVGGTYIQSSVSIVLAEEYQTVSVKVTLGSDNTGGLRYYIVKAGSNPAAAIIAKMPGLEKKTLRTPHIPTADVPASRGNASVYMLGRAFESVYDKREWTQVIECDMLEAGGVEDFLYNTTGAPNSVYSIRRSANSTIVILVRSNALSGDYVLGSFPGTGILKVAARFKKGAFAASMNGGAVVSTSHNDLGTNTTAGWYGSFSGIPVQGKYLREITTYGPGITDSQLVALSRI